jgi:hypothetical protein
MSDSPRRWFQIHLSTAVVMMFVAGGFVWANCQLFYYGRGFYVRGFPFSFYYSDVFQETMSRSFGPIEPAALVIDGLIGLMIVTACALLSECRIRRIRWALIATYLFVFCVTSFVVLIIVALLIAPLHGHRTPK